MWLFSQHNLFKLTKCSTPHIKIQGNINPHPCDKPVTAGLSVIPDILHIWLSENLTKSKQHRWSNHISDKPFIVKGSTPVTWKSSSNVFLETRVKHVKRVIPACHRPNNKFQMCKIDLSKLLSHKLWNA